MCTPRSWIAIYSTRPNRSPPGRQSRQRWIPHSATNMCLKRFCHRSLVQIACLADRRCANFCLEKSCSMTSPPLPFTTFYYFTTCSALPNSHSYHRLQCIAEQERCPWALTSIKAQRSFTKWLLSCNLSWLRSKMESSGIWRALNTMSEITACTPWNMSFPECLRPSKACGTKYRTSGSRASQGIGAPRTCICNGAQLNSTPRHLFINNWFIFTTTIIASASAGRNDIVCILFAGPMPSQNPIIPMLNRSVTQSPIFKEREWPLLKRPTNTLKCIKFHLQCHSIPLSLSSSQLHSWLSQSSYYQDFCYPQRYFPGHLGSPPSLSLALCFSAPFLPKCRVWFTPPGRTASLTRKVQGTVELHTPRQYAQQIPAPPLNIQHAPASQNYHLCPDMIDATADDTLAHCSK